MKTALAGAVDVLEDGSWILIHCGPFREKGEFCDLPFDVKVILKALPGVSIENEVVVVGPLGSAPMRWGKLFESRSALTNTNTRIVVGWKGDRSQLPNGDRGDVDGGRWTIEVPAAPAAPAAPTAVAVAEKASGLQTTIQSPSRGVHNGDDDGRDEGGDGCLATQLGADEGRAGRLNDHAATAGGHSSRLMSTDALARVGRQIAKLFPGPDRVDQYYTGRVVSVRSATAAGDPKLFVVKYDDGDQEELEACEVKQWLCDDADILRHVMQQLVDNVELADETRNLPMLSEGEGQGSGNRRRRPKKGDRIAYLFIKTFPDDIRCRETYKTHYRRKSIWEKATVIHRDHRENYADWFVIRTDSDGDDMEVLCREENEGNGDGPEGPNCWQFCHDLDV